MGVDDLVLSVLAAVNLRGDVGTYPARVRVQKPPPDAICPHLFHPPTPIQEHSQHALPQIDYLLVLLCIGRVRCVVGHGVLLWNWWDNQSRM